MSAKALKAVEGYNVFPSEQTQIADGKYKIAYENKPVRDVEADGPSIKAEIWFKSPALTIDTIRRIDRLQLLAESHDQGFADVPSAGNWTWFELAILENECAHAPRVKDGVELVWKSHDNRFLSEDYGWAFGKEFDEQHDLLRNLEDGNVIAIRLCARFVGWMISVRNGYLIIDIGSEDIVRDDPPAYGEIVSQVESIQSVLEEVNTSIQSGFKPSLPKGLYSAELLSTGNKRPLRVLSLDGGGVRGLSSLHLLNAVMKKFDPDNSKNLKPCDIFDMIGGTSTGGFIAIMLGRLQMSVDECIKVYEDFMVKIFNKGKIKKGLSFVTKGEFYDETVLEDLIKELIKKKTGDSETKLLEKEGKPSCKVFCLAVREDAINNRAPIFLRSYQNEEEMSAIPDIKIWQAARATAAAPAYFSSLKIGNYTLLDGGLGANNPLGWLWTEVLAVFGPARPTSCFLSIGTGLGANQALISPGTLGSHDVEASFAAAASNTELTHILFRSLVNAFAPQIMTKKYWRLNVSELIPAWDEEKRKWIFQKYTVHHNQDYKAVGNLDDVGALKELMEMTKKYVGDQDGIIAECAKALVAAV